MTTIVLTINHHRNGQQQNVHTNHKSLETLAIDGFLCVCVCVCALTCVPRISGDALLDAFLPLPSLTPHPTTLQQSNLENIENKSNVGSCSTEPNRTKTQNQQNTLCTHTHTQKIVGSLSLWQCVYFLCWGSIDWWTKGGVGCGERRVWGIDQSGGVGCVTECAWQSQTKRDFVDTHSTTAQPYSNSAPINNLGEKKNTERKKTTTTRTCRRLAFAND